MEEPTNNRIAELEKLVESYRIKYDDKCRQYMELEVKNRALDSAITNLTEMIKTQNKELADLRIVNRLQKDRVTGGKKLRTNGVSRCTKLACTFDGCDYITDVQDDFDFHVNVHKMATLKCPYCMYLSFNPRDLRRHVMNSDKHCRFMYKCQYCKHPSPFMTNNEAHFRAHIQKHFRGAIDDNRMNFFVESIHSASPLTVWKALNAMYKVYDIQEDNENVDSSVFPTKRRRAAGETKTPTANVQKQPVFHVTDHPWPIQHETVNPISGVEPVTNTPIEVNYQRNEESIIQRTDSIPETVSQSPPPPPPTDDSSPCQTASLIDNGDTLEQVIQFSDLNFPPGSDVILYFPDDNGDNTDLNGQVCVIQHISVQDDGLTHVTLEPSLLSDGFVPQDAHVLPAEIGDSSGGTVPPTQQIS